MTKQTKQFLPPMFPSALRKRPTLTLLASHLKTQSSEVTPFLEVEVYRWSFNLMPLKTKQNTSKEAVYDEQNPRSESLYSCGQSVNLQWEAGAKWRGWRVHPSRTLLSSSRARNTVQRIRPRSVSERNSIIKQRQQFTVR